MIRPRSWKALAAAALVGGLSCSLLLAKPGKVVTKQGQSFAGDVQDRRKEQGVVVVTTGDRQKIEVKAANVDRVEYAEELPADNAPPAPDGTVPPGPAPVPAPEAGSVEADLRGRLASLPKNDVNNRIKLARAALERREYGVARDCLDQAIQIDPRNQEAKDMLTTVDAQQRLDQRPQNPDDARTAPGNRPPGERAPGANGPSPDVMPPLSPDDINRIRQREWTRNDKGVKIRFVGDVKRRFVQVNRIPPADFNNMNTIEQAWQIVSKGDEEMRNEVRLITDPIALRDYKTIIQRAVLPTCATAACHGGGPAGSFQLYPRAEHDGEAYANFLTLSTYTYSPKPPPGPEGAGGAGAGAAGGAPGAAGPGAGAAGAPPAGGPAAAPDRGPAGGPGGGPRGAAPGAGPQGRGPAGGGGAGGGGAIGRPRTFHVIDRDRPADSLLLQFALPLNLADYPHPQVPGFKPIFRLLKDPRYEQFLRWISDELSPLQSDYGIKIGGAQGGQGQDVTRGAGQPNQQQPPQGGPGQGQPGQGQPGAGQRPAQGQPQNPGGAAQPQPPRGQ